MNMDRLGKILDAAKTARNISTDSELARQLHVTRSAVSNWRQGRNLPDAVACERLAQMTGQSVVQVIAIVGEARAISLDEKRVWRQIARVAVVVFAVGMTAIPTHVQAAANYALCEVRRGISRVRTALRCALHKEAASSARTAPYDFVPSL
jgi:transcriptional regulator with XRE-family HTH domain